MKISELHELKKKKYHDTVMETSKDTSKNPVQFMTKIKHKAVNMDKVKTTYCNELGYSEEIAKSADALVELSNNRLCVIEFKNGDFTGEEISKKALESIMIINELEKKSLDIMRENVEFALVYNKDYKNITCRQQIALAKAKAGREDYDLWGLGNLRKFCYHNVYLIEKNDFDGSSFGKMIRGI